jgi:hypothetical protein
MRLQIYMFKHVYLYMNLLWYILMAKFIAAHFKRAE